MANVKISELDPGSQAAGALIEAVQSGNSVSVIIGTMAYQSPGAVAITGGSITGITDLAVADGGTGASDASGARTNLGLVIGTNVQAYSANLLAIAALAVTDGNFIVGNGTTWVAESGATARTSLGLGTIATQDANNVTITGGSITGITDLAVADGGTGSSTAAGAATNLGLGTGNSPQFTAVNIGDAADTTLSRASAGNLQIETNIIYRAGGTDVPIADGGTGQSTAALGFAALKQDATNAATGVIEHATDAEVRASTTGNLAITPALVESASAGVALTDAATVAVNWDSAINFTLTVTASRIIGNPTNGQPGTWRTILVQGNDATDRAITFGNQYLGEVPTITDCDSTRWYLLMIFCVTTSHFVVSSKKANGT